MTIYSLFPARERLDRDSMMFASEKPRGNETELFKSIHERGAKAIHDRVAYFHVPFCDELCIFCGFMRKRGYEDDTIAYLQHAHRELDRLEDSGYVKQGHFKAVYFGGGTPSLIPAKHLARLVTRVREVLRMDDNAEFTVESAVHTLDADKLTAMRDAGVNRISFGVQTFDTASRQRLGRISTKGAVIESIQQARRAGIETLSADFLYRLPEQSLEDWLHDLQLAVELGLDGVSVYPLIELPRTALSRMIEDGRIPPLGDQKLEIDQYLMALDLLGSNGYRQDNITHFCKPSDRNLYSAIRWTGGDTLPIGAGAGGYIDGLAVMNHMATGKYAELTEASGFGLMGVVAMSDCARVVKKLNGQLNRCMLEPPPLGPCDSIEFEKRFGVLVSEWIHKGLIEPKDDGYIFTRSGCVWGKNITKAVSTLYRECRDEHADGLGAFKEASHG